MKPVFISLAIMMSAFSYKGLAQELVFNRVLNDVTNISQLHVFQIDPSSGLPSGINAGYAQIRTLGENANSITLTLFHPTICPSGKFCVMLMPPPTVIEVPVKSFNVNNCGVKAFQGFTDARRTDGALVKITVIDHSENRCPSLQGLNPTEIVYETQGTEYNQPSHTVIYGEKLHLQNEAADQ